MICRSQHAGPRARRIWTRFFTLVCACLVAACQPEAGDTSILITVDSDFLVPDEIDRVTVEATGMEDSLQDPAADLREKDLPRSIALTHAGGPYGPFQIIVSAFHGSTLVVQKTLQTSFLPGISSTLAVNLARGCAAVFCGDQLTCNAGACVPVAQTLPSASSPDAGASSDASVAAPNDAGAVSLDAAVGNMNDSGPKTDASVKPDAGTGVDAGSAIDAGTMKDAAASDARTDTGTLSDTGVISPADTGTQPASAGATPVCTISKPAANATVLTGVTFLLQGACTDAESGPLTAVAWVSSVDGPIGVGASSSGVLRTLGAHNILLCAPDPRDARVVGCATVHVNATVQPTARILSVRQGASETEPFSTGGAITIQGTATGTGATLAWRDSLQGSLGSGSTVLLNAPIVGRHVITLDVTDQYGLTAMATRTVFVIPALPGH
jgi:hypothetical protein